MGALSGFATRSTTLTTPPLDMKNLPFLGFLVTSALGLAVACGNEGSSVDGNDGNGSTCATSAQCGPSQECSGGVCVAVTTCSATMPCATGTCSDGVCRAACDDDSDCSALQLRCDTALGLCVPIETSTGSGGGSGSGGSPGTGGGDTNPEEPRVDIIDDFEDSDVAIAAIEGRVGYWYSYNENDARPRMPTSSVVTDGASAVIHATGSHQGGVALDAAYGGLGVDLNNPDPSSEGPKSAAREPYDASAWDGFQFRIRGGGSTKSIRFEIVTTQVATQVEGGDCNGDGCFDAFGMDVPLETSWTTVKVPFSSVVQEGWGAQKTFEPSAILGVAFEDLTTSDWDFSVDDLAFYKNPLSEDPGGGSTGGDPTCSGSWGEETNGSVTWYTFSQGTAAIGDVNCSYGISSNPDKVNTVVTGSGTFFGAINTTDYETAAACGACVEVSRDNGKKVTITVVDQCPVATNPKCVKGHIDLSKAAFLELGQESEGYLGARAGVGNISWKYVPCTTTADVSFRLKEPSNTYWNMVVIENHVYPIASVQVRVGSEWRNASRSEFNYWLPPGGVMGTSPYTIRATDVNGAVVEGTVALGSSSSQSSGEQFTCE